MSMRTILLVDTCGPMGGVGLAQLGGPAPRMLAQRTVQGRETQEQLMLALDELFVETSLTPAQLAAIAVVSGPGSFTGVRIGLAAVKGMAEAMDVPVLAVSRLALLAAQLPSASQAWIDAGRGDVFVRVTGVSEAMMHLSTAVAALQPADVVVVMEAALADAVAQAVLVDAVGIGAMLPLVAQASSHDFADAALLDANYLRVPDAQLALEAAAQ